MTIPAGVTFIGSDAFDGCESLKEVSLSSAEPPTIYKSEYSWYYNSYVIAWDWGVDREKCTIYVPADSVETYTQAWPFHKNQIKVQGVKN